MILKWILPNSTFAEKQEEFRARLLVYFLVLNAIVAISLYLLDHYITIFPSSHLLLTSIVSVSLLFLLKVFRSITIISNLFAFCAYSIAVLIINETGLFYSSSMALLPVINLGTYLLLGFRYGFLWSLIIFITYLAIFWITDHHSNPAVIINDIVINKDKLLATNCVLYFFCMTIVFIFRYQYNLINKELENSRNEVHKINSALKRESELIKKKGKELAALNLDLRREKRNLAISEEKLKYSNEELESYAHAASHDLKQPIRTIHSFSNLLEKHLARKGWTDEVTEEYLEFIKTGSNNMSRLVNDLLEYGKMSAIDNLHFKANSLDRLFKNVELGLKENISKSQARIICDPLPQLEVIPVKISQVFINLINNAIKFRSKKRALLIKVSAVEKETHWLFSIHDNGIGIEAEFLKQIFEPFRKLHLNRIYDGSGLGLSTCKRIIKIHKGEIWVESRIGVGTTFFFTIQKGLQNDNDMPVMNEDIKSQKTLSIN